jgi:hypothetical protein
MSNWKRIYKADLEIGIDGEELEICLGSDEAGNNYANVLLSDIFELLQQKLKSKS